MSEPVLEVAPELRTVVERAQEGLKELGVRVCSVSLYWIEFC